MKLTVFIERASDGSYSAYMDNCEHIDYSCIGTGNSADETKKDFIQAYEEMKMLYAKRNEKFKEIEFEFKYDVASFLSYYSNILSLAGLSRLTGVNQGQLSHYVTGRRKPSQKTIAKIEKDLHRFASELSNIHFL